ncbi:MAG TPA: hydroxyacid dehydrogenase [Elusimicrobiota bacterium]|nr:hydroxyacid dehydrogenase [Elusimicrobiota bacterium]
MALPRVAFFEAADWESEQLKKTKSFQAVWFREELTPRTAALAAPFDAVSIFIYSQLSADALKKLPKLKMIATRSTGFDHIHLPTCRKRGITVSNVPFYGENTVAEHTFALILSLSRNIHRAYVRTIRGDFSLEGLRGFDLQGKTIGVIGAGHIGLHVIKMARGFGMRALAFDVRRNPFMAEVLGFEYASLDEILAQADVLSLHAPYSEKTRHLIGLHNIRRIKKGALLINTSRGGLVQTDALIKALDEGIIAGAGLDVLEGEDLVKEDRQLLSEHFPLDRLQTLLKNHILLHRDNVVITPHIAFYSQEALQRILDTTVANLQGFFKGNPLNVVK